jgi:hypothetical protein
MRRDEIEIKRSLIKIGVQFGGVKLLGVRLNSRVHGFVRISSG